MRYDWFYYRHSAIFTASFKCPREIFPHLACHLSFKRSLHPIPEKPERKTMPRDFDKNSGIGINVEYLSRFYRRSWQDQSQRETSITSDRWRPVKFTNGGQKWESEEKKRPGFDTNLLAWLGVPMTCHLQQNWGNNKDTSQGRSVEIIQEGPVAAPCCLGGGVHGK